MSEAEVKALAVKLEDAWLALGEMRQTARRTLFLTRNANISAMGDRASIVIGTYSPTVKLCDFRDDVFAAFEELKGRNNG